MAQEAKTCGVIDWGLEPYARVCAWQKELVAARKAGRIPDVLLLGEHPHVITRGRNSTPAHQRLPDKELARRGVEVYETDRGGDVTYHGPGQLVGYPILDLGGIWKDVVWYVRALEEVLMRAAREWGVAAKRNSTPVGKRPFYTGVWVGEEKLAAIGVHISRWVTSHGFAFNVSTDLSYFDLIVPCGIRDKGVTSLERLLGSSSSAHGPARPARLRNGQAGGLPPVGLALGPSGSSTTPSPQAPLPRAQSRGAWGKFNPSGRGRWAERNEGSALMEKVKVAVVKHFGEVFDREMRGVEPETLSRAKSRGWEAWIGAHQAAIS